MCNHTYPSLKSQSIRLVTWHSTHKRQLVQLLYSGIWASPRRQPRLFGMQLKCSMHVSRFVINNITKAHTRGSKRNRLSHCSLLYQGLSSVKWALLFPAARESPDCQGSLVSWPCCPLRAQQSLLSLHATLSTSNANGQHNKKGHQCPRILMQAGFTFWEPCPGFGDLPGSHTEDHHRYKIQTLSNLLIADVLAGFM